MKTLLSVLAILVINAAIAQSTVTVKTSGSRYKQVVVDNKTYTIDNSTGTEQSVVITGLLPGQHSLGVIRNNLTNRNVSTTFTVRDGYDLALTISSNGTVSTTETRTARNNTGGQLSATAYNRIYTQTRNRTGATARATYLGNQFSASNRRMTAKQASQLIQLVNSESKRLSLAKQSYTLVSDPQNFSLVTNLLNSTASRNELNTYIASAGSGTIVNDGTALTAAEFRTIYNEVVAERLNSDRIYYLNNYFTRDNNYYTTDQVKQLIQLVSGEQDRLTLTKNAYRGVTDKQYYYNSIYSLLTSSSSRLQLSSYINSVGGVADATATREPMGDTEFKNIYRDIQMTFGLGAKYSELTKVFNTTTYYFTTAQAKQLIQLVSSESNRLELAKLSYDNVTDRSNFNSIYDLFSQTNRNELIAYVGSVSGL